MWIDFEGIDGSGKTTISVRVALRLREAGLRVHHPREEGRFRSPLVGRIRELTRSGESMALAPETEFLLNAAREAQLLAEEIRPALARGEVVVTDRALHAHLATGAFVRGLAFEDASRAARLASSGLWPDLVVLVDVDPEVARLRKRLRKIREKRLGSAGRKGLLGQSYLARLRGAFRTLAARDPERWRVLENSTRGVDEAVAEAMAMAAPALGVPAPPRPPAPVPRCVSPGRSLEDWADRFFDFARQMEETDPGLALLYTAGLDDPRADEIRARAAESIPDVAAWSVSGMDTPASWDLRRLASRDAPYHVARSLTGLDVPGAWTWREELQETVPEQVLHSVSGLPGDRAHEFRADLWSLAPDEAVRSLAGLADGRSWGFRLRSLREAPTAALAESLSGLGTESSWHLRSRLRPEFPLSVLRSVKRLADGRAWALRRDLVEGAPRVVLETLTGLDGPEAEAIRDDLERRCPDEVAESLAGLDTSGAWRRRARLVQDVPESVLAGVAGLNGSHEAAALVEHALASSDGRPSVVRRAVSLHLKRICAARGTPQAPGGSREERR